MSFSHLLLPLLTLIYVVGELGHFLIGVVSRSMAQNIGYGDKSCFAVKILENASSRESWEFCKGFDTQLGCVLARTEFEDDNDTSMNPCEWNFNGLGTQYQVLAGPAYMACFTTAGIIWGLLADKMNRIYLLGMATIGAGVAIAGTAFAAEYWHLVLLRMALAIGAAACTPLAAGILDDVCPQKKRAVTMGVFNSGIYMGYGGSFALGSYVTDTTFFNESWRTSFLICGIPAVIIAIIFMITVTEPRNDLTNETHEMQENEVVEAHSADDNATMSLLELFTRPEILVLIVAACIRHSGAYCWGYNSALYFQTYYPDFDAGWWLTGISMGAGVLGCVLGGVISDHLVRFLGISARVLMLGVTQLISTPFTVAVLYLVPPYSFLALFFATVTSEMWFGVMYAFLLESLPPQFKSTGMAMALFVINNVGGNLPILVGPVSQILDYRNAILIQYPGALFASSLLFFGCWSLLLRRIKRI